MKYEQDMLLQSIRDRAIENAGLRQTIQLFMISNKDNDLVRQIWRHQAFMIALDSSPQIDISMDDQEIIPSQHHSYDNVKDNRQRRGSLTTDDLNRDDIHKILDDNKDQKHHRRFTRAFVEQFNDNVQVFRYMLDKPVGYEFEADLNYQAICDPIHDHQLIYGMKIKKIFQSAAKPILIETLNENYQSIGSFILKEGDDLRQDENMMFMFQLSMRMKTNMISIQHKFTIITHNIS